MRLMKFERAAMLVATMAFLAGPMMAQTATQEHQETTTTTTTSAATDSGAAVPMSAHQLRKNERADKKQAKADKAERKLATSGKMHNAEKKQDQADRAAANANNPY